MAFPRKLSSIPSVITGLLLFCGGAVSQETNPQAQPSPQPSIVRLNVLVTDGANQPVTDLRQEEFRVLEDGKPQAISTFSHDQIPVSYGVVIDASGSQRELLNEI